MTTTPEFDGSCKGCKYDRSFDPETGHQNNACCIRPMKIRLAELRAKANHIADLRGRMLDALEKGDEVDAINLSDDLVSTEEEFENVLGLAWQFLKEGYSSSPDCTLMYCHRFPGEKLKTEENIDEV